MSYFSVDDWDTLSNYLSAQAKTRLQPTDKIYMTDIQHWQLRAAYDYAHDESTRCQTCQGFILRYGSLAVVRDGKLVPAFWARLPADDSKKSYYQQYSTAMNSLVDLFANAKITTAFTPEHTTIGIPMCGGFNHFNFQVPKELLGHNVYESSEGPIFFEVLTRVLEDNSKDVIAKAHDLLVYDRVAYAEHAKGPIKWLSELKTELANLVDEKGAPAYTIRVQQAVHTSPTGFISSCRSGLVSVVLDSIREGDGLETTKAKYVDRAGPTKYMRPQSDPAAGAIATAERVFAEMGITKEDMARRFAMHSDVAAEHYLWRHVTAAAAQEDKKDGLFSHLPVKTKPADAAVGGLTSTVETKITMAKFVKEVLPQTKDIEFYVPGLLNAYTFVTGNKGTRPLMQWHHADNLVSWYTYPDRQSAIRWGLPSYSWMPVHAILPFPHMWKRPAHGDKDTKETKDAGIHSYSNHKIGYLFTIPGCYDTQHKTGAGLFPALMKSQFHEVRSVIESFSNRATVADLDKVKDHGLCGLGVRPSQDELEGGPHKLRVTTKSGSKLIYVLDRMD